MKALGKIIGFILICTVIAAVTYGIGLIPITIYLILLFKGSSQRIENANEKFKSSVLMDSENLQEKAGQLRAHALFARRKIIAITDSRIILITRKLFGGFQMRDYQWKDLSDAKVDEDMLPNLSGSTLIFVFTNLSSLEIVGVPSDSAMEIYKYAQRQEQAWEEKRRVRTLEEKRALSGGITIGSQGPAVPAPVPNAPTTSNEGSMIDEIRKAKELLDAGAISDAEFEEIKAKMLSRSSGTI